MEKPQAKQCRKWINSRLVFGMAQRFRPTSYRKQGAEAVARTERIEFYLSVSCCAGHVSSQSPLHIPRIVLKKSWPAANQTSKLDGQFQMAAVSAPF
jgi:hypothetical protein